MGRNSVRAHREEAWSLVIICIIACCEVSSCSLFHVCVAYRFWVVREYRDKPNMISETWGIKPTIFRRGGTRRHWLTDRWTSHDLAGRREQTFKSSVYQLVNIIGYVNQLQQWFWQYSAFRTTDYKHNLQAWVYTARTPLSTSGERVLNHKKKIWFFTANNHHQNKNGRSCTHRLYIFCTAGLDTCPRMKRSGGSHRPSPAVDNVWRRRIGKYIYIYIQVPSVYTHSTAMDPNTIHTVLYG